MNNGDILWELWVEGFEKVVKLCPVAWQKLLDTDTDATIAMRGMRMLIDIACDDLSMPRKSRRALIATAPDDIVPGLLFETAKTPRRALEAARRGGRYVPNTVPN